MQNPKYGVGIDILAMGWKGFFCQTPVLGLGLGVDFTFAWDNNNNNNDKKNPHLNFREGTVPRAKGQGVGIREKR